MGTQFAAIRRSASALIVVVVCVGFAAPQEARAGFIGGLDLVSNSSIFETGSIDNLPAQGWDNVSGTARIHDGITFNGAVIATGGHPYDSFEVQYLTGVLINPGTQYTLHFDMGFVAGWWNGVADYSFELGTFSGSSFTTLGTATGLVNYLGNIAANVISASADLVYTTGDVVSGNQLAVRWTGTNLSVAGYSDYFGFDNVTLDANAVPEPASLALLGLGLLGLGFSRRKKA